MYIHAYLFQTQLHLQFGDPVGRMGHFRLFKVLAIVNSPAMSIGVHRSFQIIVLSGYIPRSRLLDHMTALLLIF